MINCQSIHWNRIKLQSIDATIEFQEEEDEEQDVELKLVLGPSSTFDEDRDLFD